MEQLKKFLSRIRLVYQRSSNATKCVVIAAIVVCTLVLISLRVNLQQAEARAEVLRAEAAELVEENSSLNRSIDNLDTVEGLKEIAYKYLGFVDPDTVIFEPEE